MSLKINVCIKNKIISEYNGIIYRGKVLNKAKKILSKRDYDSICNGNITNTKSMPINGYVLQNIKENEFDILLLGKAMNRKNEFIDSITEAFDVIKIESSIVKNKKIEKNIIIKTLTPFFTKNNLALAILTRNKNILKYWYEKTISFNKEEVVINKDLKNVSFSRFSTRQRRKMSLNGYSGVLNIKNISNENLETISYSEIFNIGKYTTFGFGNILIEKELM